ncbi:hypothetical protein H2198_003188 [Neophaeococcomyces mojaviensis]|uniref:Uncharacterized protein n=1 Tax=Neophaeococcomyces mojaviensis TaxID=3383035 RepID=A0ACC3ACH0_9EURO|nr:hypothetical protein H2198_003188 [Knufia sp. JES_112]
MQRFNWHAWRLTYNVTKPFPFQWFTLFVVIEFVIATILFSFVSFTTSGFNLVSEYYANPNTTETQSVIAGVSSFFTSRFTPKCQSAEILVGTDFSTNNSALTYTINSVKQANQIFSSSLVYHNNPFQDCVVNNIKVAFESFDRTAAQIGRAKYAPDLTASVTCNQPVPYAEFATINITAKYNYIPSTVGIYDGYTVFLGRNATSQASLYWGESLLAWYWSLFGWQMTVFNENYFWGNDGTWTKGTYYFTLNTDGTHDMTFYDFLKLLYRAVSVDQDGRYTMIADGAPNTTAEFISKGLGNRLTNAFKSADYLAKSFYSVVMTDLGQVDLRPNILVDPVLLHNFTAGRNESEVNGTAEVSGLPLRTYVASDDANRALGVRRSVIASSYLCQVPRQKSMGELIIAVLVADLVLLQALWNVTMIIAGWFVVSKDRKADWCKGCLTNMRADGMPRHTSHVSGEASGGLGAKGVTHRGETELSNMQSLLTPSSGVIR